jgi:hypothetical protein
MSTKPARWGFRPRGAAEVGPQGDAGLGIDQPDDARQVKHAARARAIGLSWARAGPGSEDWAAGIRDCSDGPVAVTAAPLRGAGSRLGIYGPSWDVCRLRLI